MPENQILKPAFLMLMALEPVILPVLAVVCLKLLQKGIKTGIDMLEKFEEFLVVFNKVSFILLGIYLIAFACIHFYW